MVYKIAVIDDVFMDGEQRERLRNMGDLSVYEGMSPSHEKAIERIENADIIICGWTDITEDILSKVANLKFVAIWATGYDYVDLEAATKRGILVTNVPGYAAQSVAEHTFALMFALVKNLIMADAHVRSGKYSWQEFRGIEIKGKTLGVIGTGAIGAQVARIGKCFGMQVIAYTVHPSPDRANKLGVEYVELDELLRQSDFITLHVPLVSTTKQMLSAREFSLMKPSAFLINTARAAIVDQEALYRALSEGKIAGAGLDDIINPDNTQNPLYRLNNVILTPHMGFHTLEALKRKTNICLANVQAFINGHPQNVVNPEALG